MAEQGWRITDWFRLEGTFKDDLIPNPLSWAGIPPTRLCCSSPVVISRVSLFRMLSQQCPCSQSLWFVVFWFSLWALPIGERMYKRKKEAPLLSEVAFQTQQCRVSAKKSISEKWLSISSFSLVQVSLRYLPLQSLNPLQIDLKQLEKFLFNILVKCLYLELLGGSSVIFFFFIFLMYMLLIMNLILKVPHTSVSGEFWHIWIPGTVL